MLATPQELCSQVAMLIRTYKSLYKPDFSGKEAL